MKFNHHQNESDVAPSCNPKRCRVFGYTCHADAQITFLLIFKLSICQVINHSTTTSSYSLILLYGKYMDQDRKKNRIVITLLSIKLAIMPQARAKKDERNRQWITLHFCFCFPFCGHLLMSSISVHSPRNIQQKPDFHQGLDLFRSSETSSNCATNPISHLLISPKFMVL